MTIARLRTPVLGLSKRACWLISIAICAVAWGGIVFLLTVIAGVQL